MSKSLLSVTGVFILGGILLFLNGLSGLLFSSWSVDLTEQGLYTLSGGTKKILKSVTEPVTLRYYFSNTDAAQFPMLKIYGKRVQELLKEYERVSNGNITLEIYDPRPDTEDEEWAQKYGLTPLPLLEGSNVYFGLAGSNGLGEEDAIAMFDLQRQENLEYDITKLVYNLIRGKKPIIGILSGVPIKGEPLSPMEQVQGRREGNEPWVFVEQLENLYQVRHLEPSMKDVASDVDLLMVIHPKQLSDVALYAIDQYVLRGGKLFVAVDPYCQHDNPMPANPQNPAEMYMAERKSDLNRLLSSWGVELVKDKVVGDASLATQVSSGQGGQVVDFLVWLHLNQNNVNTNDIATNSLRDMVLPWSGALQLKPLDGITTEALLSSTDTAMLIEEEEYRFGGGEPKSLQQNYKKGSEKRILAARVSGKFKSNFPNGAPAGAAATDDAEKNEENMSSASKEHLKESSGMSNVVVVADVDFMADRFSVRSQNLFGQRLVSLINQNLVFVLNAVENLTGSNDLISLRSRGSFSRPFSKVQEIEREAQERWAQQEQLFQAQLNTTNQKIRQLQSQGGGEEAGGQVLTTEVFEEIKKLRQERSNVQKELREVRRKLREDKEALGVRLFLVNTFFMPMVLILGSLLWASVQRDKARKSRAQDNNANG